MDGAFGAVQEGVEVELFLACGDIVGHHLGAVHTTLTCSGIEGTAAAGVFELHLGNTLGVVIGDDEAAEGDDAVEGEGEVDGVGGDSDVLAVKEGVAVAIAVVELDGLGVGHGGVALAAVGHDDELEGAGVELEGGLAEAGVGRGLVDLLEAGVAIIDGEVEVGAGVGGGGAGVVGEGGLLQLEDADGEVASGSAAGRIVSEVGGFAGGEGQEKEKAPSQPPPVGEEKRKEDGGEGFAGHGGG